jgi:thiol-disulfide isomerase/thioredoxin
MSASKKIFLIIVVIIIIGSIWYLESMKVHPAGSGSGQLISISQNIASDTVTTSVSGTSSPAITTALQALAITDKQAGYQPAKEIMDPTGFVNASSSFKLAGFIGKKVILLDFWTYSCINCIRTLPYVTAWYGKYENTGLEIVGIHTPEFDFEKNIANVQAATVQYGIHYPVILDSNYGTWDAYGNLYWPHEYLIDMAGYIVHDQIGEGNYSETETEIQKALTERATILGLNPANVPTGIVNVAAVAPSAGAISPETYFGAERNGDPDNGDIANGTQSTPGTQTLAVANSTNLSQNAVYLAGTWNFSDQYATNVSAEAKIFYNYNAARVYLVASASPSSTPVTIQVLQDGKPISAQAAGSDVRNGILTVSASRLYSIVNNPDGVGNHVLELIINSPGLEAFTFTFG